MKGKSGKSPTEFTLTAPEAKKKTRAPAAPRSTDGEPTGDYRHDDTRKNNPPAGLIDLDKPPPQPKRKYAYDPHLDPQLEWSGKAEHTSFEVDTVSLHIHERISAQAIMRAVKREDAQRSLFGKTARVEGHRLLRARRELGKPARARRLPTRDELALGTRADGGQGAVHLHGSALWSEVQFELPATHLAARCEGRRRQQPHA